MQVINHIVSAAAMVNGFSLKSRELRPDGTHGPAFMLGIPARETRDGEESGAWMEDRVLCNLLGFAVRPEGDDFTPEEADEWLTSFDSDDMTDEDRQALNPHRITISIWAERRNGRPDPIYQQIEALSEEAGGAATYAEVDIRSISGRVAVKEDGEVGAGWLCRVSGVKLVTDVAHTTKDAVTSYTVTPTSTRREGPAAMTATIGAKPKAAAAAPSGLSRKGATTFVETTSQERDAAKAGLPAGWQLHPDDPTYAYKGNDVVLVSELVKPKAPAIPAAPKVPALPKSRAK